MKLYKNLREIYEKYPNAYFIMWCGELSVEYGKLKDDSPELDIEPLNGIVRIYEDGDELIASFEVNSFFD